MSVYQNRGVKIDWGVRLMTNTHRVIIGLVYFVIGSVISALAIQQISSGWIIGVIAMTQLLTLVLVFGVEVNEVVISRERIKLDFGQD